jgi:hypothetical protein
MLKQAMLWMDPKMSLYGRMMLKIKMSDWVESTDNDSVMSDGGKSDE